LATDGGGSIRRPASYTGLAGFKPSVGRVPRGDGFPEMTADCEVIGPIARDVTGLRMLFDAIADPPSGAITPDRLRILFVPAMGDAPVEPAIVARAHVAAAQLATLGHVVTEGELPFDITPSLVAWSALGGVGLAQLAAAHANFFAEAAPDFCDQARAGAAIGGEDHAHLIHTLQALRQDAARAFAGIDVIMTPSVAAQPWPLGEFYPSRIAGQDVGPRGHAIFTGWVNAAGLPAIALPAEPDENGMPVGFQLVGGLGSDDMLLALAAAYEAAHPWADRWPAII
jgi:aspartyl-tRNA(Asn)/glutamyl-tRNA(Gln) amidotransferase subunit A